MPNTEYSEEHYDELLTLLAQQTFHHSDETAKPIVDEFVKSYPEILDKYTLDFLYKI